MPRRKTSSAALTVSAILCAVMSIANAWIISYKTQENWTQSSPTLLDLDSFNSYCDDFQHRTDFLKYLEERKENMNRHTVVSIWICTESLFSCANYTIRELGPCAVFVRLGILCLIASHCIFFQQIALDHLGVVVTAFAEFILNYIVIYKNACSVEEVNTVHTQNNSYATPYHVPWQLLAPL